MAEKAFNNFLEKGLPNKNWEDWRHTDLKPIKEIDFRLSEISDAPAHELDITEFGLDDVHTIVIYNGHYQENISSVPNGLPYDILNGVNPKVFALTLSLIHI